MTAALSHQNNVIREDFKYLHTFPFTHCCLYMSFISFIQLCTIILYFYIILSTIQFVYFQIKSSLTIIIVCQTDITNVPGHFILYNNV